MTTALLYARFSPRPARPGETQDSVDKQLIDLRARAKQDGHSELEEYADKDEHGDEWDRPGLMDALRAIKPGMVLYARNLDRIARDTGILAYVRHQVLSRGATIVTLETGTVENNPVSKFLSTILGGVAELQKDLIGQRSKMAVQRKLKDGTFQGNIPPYGYRHVNPEKARRGVEEPDYRIEEVPEQLEQIAIIQQLDAEGKRIADIVRELNDSGLVYRDGKAWCWDRVRTVLARSKPKRPKRRKMPKG